MKRIWIKNGRVIDGTNTPAHTADVIVEGDRIVSVGEPGSPSDTVIDAAGKVVCPGFVDIHRHCDAKFLQDSDFGKVMLAQGITTTVVGNCGMSLTPSPKDPTEMYDFMEAVLGSGCEKLGLHDYKDYVAILQSRPLPVNAASMVGTGSVKITVKGFADTPYTAEELKKAASLIEDALNAGAVGVSCGIMYLPECYSTTNEFAEILKPLGKAGRVLTAHIRGEGDSLVSSVKEIIEIGKKAGCPVEISHFKCCGMENWRKGIHEAIALIEEARAAGQDVTCDFYPYEGGSTALTTMLPPCCVAGDMTAALARLGTPEGVEEFRKAAAVRYDDWDNYAITLGWDRILISGVSAPENRRFLGLTVEEAAKKFGFPDSASCAAHLMHTDNGKTAIINMSMCQEDIDTVARLPYSTIISDSIYADTDTPHPRMYGSFPKIIREYVNERHVLTLEQAIEKMASRPARRMGLKNRGELRPGAYADLLIFDPDTFKDRATFSEPTLLAEGLSYALLNGVPVWQDGELLSHSAGRCLLADR